MIEIDGFRLGCGNRAMRELINNNEQIHKLSECLDYNRIDSILDEIGIENNIEKRIVFLHRQMNISQSFSCSCDNHGITLDEEYAFARQQLVFMNERQMEKGQKV